MEWNGNGTCNLNSFNSYYKAAIRQLQEIIADRRVFLHNFDIAIIFIYRGFFGSKLYPWVVV